MAAADIAKITARVLWIIGARSSAFDATVSDDRFIQEEIRRAIIETESDIVRALCESTHPMRTQFLAWSTDLANGDTLPARTGQVEAVRIKPYAAAGSYNIAESTSRENIRLWRANTANVFDAINHDQNGSALAGYYNITNETITFTGSAAQVKTCTYTPDYTTPALVIDNQFDTVLVAGTIPRLNKIGVPQALVVSYGQMFANLIGMIRQGTMTAPDIAQAQQHE